MLWITAVRGLITVIATNLLLVLLTGGYVIPYLEFRSEHPTTNTLLLILLSILHLWLLRRRDKREFTEGDKNLLIGLLIWASYLANFRWRGSGDVVAASLQPFALLQQGNLYLNPYFQNFLSDTDITWVYFRDGHVLSMYPSAAGLLLVPFYAITALAGVFPTDLFIHQLQKVGASFMVALSAYIMLRALSKVVVRKWAVLLTAAYALGTSSLSTSSQAIWQHGPGQLFIALGLYGLVSSPNRIFLSGFAFAMATWCRYSNLWVFIAIFFYLLMTRREELLQYTAGALGPFCALALDNVFHSGVFWSTGYQASATQFTTNLLSGIAGLLFSPARGLFLYSPFFLFSMAGFWVSFSKEGGRLPRFLAAGVAATVIFYGLYAYWWGGWCFGPRYLADLSPLLVWGIVPFISTLEASPRLKILFQLSVSYSIVVHVIGAFFRWWWEALPVKIWSFSNYPVTYLLSKMGGSSRSEEVVIGWLLSGILLFLISRSMWRIRDCKERGALYERANG